MPIMSSKNRPASSGYARLAQADEHDDYEEYSDEDDPYAHPPTISSRTNFAPINNRPRMRAGSRGSSISNYQPRGLRRHARSDSSGVDIKAINMRLERWAEEIAAKFKSNKSKRSDQEEKLEIHHSVFQPPEGIKPYNSSQLEQLFAESGRMTPAEFDAVIQSVNMAIDQEVHPKMISQGSSGSYFARNTEGKVVGVFKPKDEEPYATRNPKWTKWVHRNLFPCCFGRACLIPNLSYVSEAAAYVLDTRLMTNLVPYTDVVWLSSKSFFYDFWDRRKARRFNGRRQLPPKIGSFQVFLKGFKDANLFLRDHPWPDPINGEFTAENAPPRKKRTWTRTCVAADDEQGESQPMVTPSPSPRDIAVDQRFHWTENLKQSFREELEKLVILDYIMRNTDRGLDNWMIKVDRKSEQVSIVSDPPHMSTVHNHMDDYDDDDATDMRAPRPVPARSDSVYRRQEEMLISRSGTPASPAPNSTDNMAISIGAIDNSLSWPWKHPDAVCLFLEKVLAYTK